MTSKSIYLDEKFRREFPWSLWWVLSDSTKNRLLYLYNVFGNPLGWIWPGAYVIGGLAFTDWNGWDPILYRVFDKPLYLNLYVYRLYIGESDHHLFDFLSIAGLAFALAIYFARQHGLKARSFFNYGLIAAFGSLVMWCAHEGYWWITAIIVHPSVWGHPLHLVGGFGQTLTVCVLLLYPVVTIGYWKWSIPWRFMLWVGGFYVVWALIGFPVTIWYSGPTQYYNSVTVSAIEELSWIWAAWGYWHFERRNLLTLFDKLKGVMSTRIDLKA